MKLQRTSFGLLVVAALLAGVVAVYEQQQKAVPTASVDQPASQRVFDFSEDAIALVTIATRRPAPKPSPSPTADPQASPSPSPSPTVSPSPSPSLVPMALTIERVAGQWQLSAPMKVPANPATVTFLTNLLTTTQRDRTLVVSPDRAAEFGLDQPMGTITITLTDQKQHKLVLGKPSFDRTFLYALIDPDPQAKELSVALISPQFANAVDRDLAEWQVEKKVDKTVATPTPEVTPAATPTPSPSAVANPSPAVIPSPQTSPQPEASPTAKP